MRARNLKPGFFKNEDLADIDPLGRLLFQGLWCMADREGRLEDRPKRIRVEVLPYDNCSIDKLLNILHDKKFILRYSIDGAKYIQILNFSKHQSPHIKEQESTIPEPDLHQTNTIPEPDLHRSCPPDSLFLDSSTDSLKCATTGRTTKKFIHDPVFYTGTYFELTESQYKNLRSEGNGMTDQEFEQFLVSLDLYIPNHPTKYHRKANGYLKNPANILSRWLKNQTLIKGNGSGGMPAQENTNCINHPGKPGTATKNGRWYCRMCLDRIDAPPGKFDKPLDKFEITVKELANKMEMT